jgi:ABC-2 type transport system ATP-binding protein
MTTDAIVETDGLEVRYGRVRAVQDLSLGVAPGEVVALLGRNGSGKSSAVRALLGMLEPSAGVARLFGADSWRERAGLMARVGVVPERLDMPPDMTLAALERYTRPLYPTWDADGFAARLARFGVPSDRPFGKLSKGQQRQGALALAVASRPELVVLDDPTLGLDPVARDALFREVVDDLAERGATVLLTSHDLAGVEQIADRVGILAAGRLLLDEPLESLKGRWRRVRVVAADGVDVAQAAAALHDAGARVRSTTGRVVEGVTDTWSDELAERLEADPRLEEVARRALPLDAIFREVCSDGGVA